MSYLNCQSNSKAPAFVTKVPHEVVLTQTDTRIFVKNIKTGVTLDQFKNAMEKYGPVQVYLYEHGSKDNGWAWVGFEDKETAEKAVRDYECGEAETSETKPEESHSIPNDTVQNENEDEEKQETNSFYAEAEEQNESEANDNDESVKEEESDEEAD